MRQYLQAPLATSRMPGGIPFIIGNEAAERFSFYGMKCILTVFMIQYLHWMGQAPTQPLSVAQATERYHGFTTWVYFFPIIGALLSDSVWGKYRTILWLSIVYCLGHLALALMGWCGDPRWWLFLGLALISVGSGGIKPCVSAHVGDQFGRSNAHLLPKVFNFFYLAINVGAFVSTLLTPWVLKWYGPHWAFGIPGVLMALATWVFWLGRHRFVHISPGGVGFLRETFSPLGLGTVAKLAVIYCFVAVFWALFDQTGSSWVIQAEDMNRRWLGITWLAPQIQAINPIMILILVPLFTLVIYPTFEKIWPLTPMRKISLGMFVIVGGFAVVAVVQQSIDAGHEPSIGWQVLAYAVLTTAEVMVSITCLEFSYTQAPKSMKSVVMALFLLSISLGNLFTAGINRFIQVPSTLKEIDRVAQADHPRRTDRVRPVAAHQWTHVGFDRQFGTTDDVRVTYDADGRRVDVQAEGAVEAEQGVALVEQYRADEGRLPSQLAGQALLQRLVDPWEHPVRYHLINRHEYRITTLGADAREDTPFDVGVNVRLPVAATKASGGFMARWTPDQPWLERRQREMAVAADQGVPSTRDGAPTADSSETLEVTKRVFVGGQTRLEGAAYFWFFTALMAVAAVSFVLVALFYQPREFLHEERSLG